tara:strand:+ start:748 stop:984 length:237 start_codon:yes stop_codon:yes gene_type:complete
MEFVYIEWVDSAGADEAWTGDEIELAHIKSCGILIKDVRESVTIAQSVDDNDPPKYDCLLIIPTVAIISRRRYEEPRP